MTTCVTYSLDYYSFGSVIPGRSFTSSNAYRYGFNGMEKEDEIAEGTYTTPFREIDTRLGGRWWSTDPIVKPWESPYAGFSNNPIIFSDPSGLDPGDEATDASKQKIKNTNGDGTIRPGDSPDGDLCNFCGENGEDLWGLPNEPTKSEEAINTTPSDNLVNSNKIPVSLPYDQRLKNYQNYITNRLVNDYDFAAKVITETMRNDPIAGRELFTQIVTARNDKIGKSLAEAFAFGITMITPIPGDEAIALGIGRACGSALNLTTVVLPKLSPRLTTAMATFEGGATLRFAWNKSSLKYSTGNFYKFNKMDLNFSTNLITSNSNTVFNQLGLGFSGNTVSASYNIYSGSFKGFYLEGRILGQGASLGQGVQFVGFKGFTKYSNYSKIGTTF